MSAMAYIPSPLATDIQTSLYRALFCRCLLDEDAMPRVVGEASEVPHRRGMLGLRVMARVDRLAHERRRRDLRGVVLIP